MPLIDYALSLQQYLKALVSSTGEYWHCIPRARLMAGNPPALIINPTAPPSRAGSREQARLFCKCIEHHIKVQLYFTAGITCRFLYDVIRGSCPRIIEKMYLNSRFSPRHHHLRVPPRRGVLEGETRSLGFADIAPIKTVDWHTLAHRRCDI